jgi:hypothetical protein
MGKYLYIKMVLNKIAWGFGGGDMAGSSAF